MDEGWSIDDCLKLLQVRLVLSSLLIDEDLFIDHLFILLGWMQRTCESQVDIMGV